MTEDYKTAENVIDRLFGSLVEGDAAFVAECLTEDGVVWHSFDKKEMTVADVTKSWEGMGANFMERGVFDVRRQETPTGFVQQHLFILRNPDGTRKAWPVCIVVKVRDGRIARLDEYIDLSAPYDPGEGPYKTPGL
jgi:ketosteroid isomerase-like protein